MGLEQGAWSGLEDDEFVADVTFTLGAGNCDEICPVLVDRREELGGLQPMLEAPVISCDWLVGTNRPLLYSGMLPRPSFHAWGGTARWNEAPDTSSFSYGRIGSVTLDEAGGEPRLG